MKNEDIQYCIGMIDGEINHSTESELLGLPARDKFFEIAKKVANKNDKVAGIVAQYGLIEIYKEWLLVTC